MSTIKPVAYMNPNEENVKDAFSWTQEDDMIPVIALTDEVRMAKTEDIRFALMYYYQTGGVQTLIDQLNTILENN